MADKWFLAGKGKGFGPFSASQLQQMVEAGVIEHDDLVWREGDPESAPASTVGNDPLPLPVVASRPSPPPLPAPSTPALSPRPSRFGLWLSLSAVLLVMLGGGWFAYERGWLPLGEGTDFADASVAQNSSSDNTADDGPEPSEPSLSSKEDGKAEVAVIKPIEQKRPAPEVPDSAPKDPTPTTAGAEPRLPPATPAPSGRVVAGNVALSRRGAVVTGPYRDAELMFDGRSNDKESYAKAKLNVPIVVTLPEVYQLRLVRLRLVETWSSDKSTGYRYRMEVSKDGVNYETVANRTSGLHRDWQDITFSPRPVKSIRITGTYDHPHQTGIRIAEIEAYCTSR